MITIKKENLHFIGTDSWCRPVYQYKDKNYYFKDVTLKGTADNIPSILYCSYDDIEGEPDYAVRLVGHVINQ